MPLNAVWLARLHARGKVPPKNGRGLPDRIGFRLLVVVYDVFRIVCVACLAARPAVLHVSWVREVGGEDFAWLAP
jgi:hypothetical protein